MVDRAGLTEAYDFSLTFGPEEGHPEMVVSAEDAVRGLGLRFERTKAPIPFLIVDHIERVPTAN